MSLSRQRLSNEEAQHFVKESDWAIVDNKFERDFLFKDFKEAWSFLSRVALISEELNHHAEIFNVYNQVTLKLSTHECEDGKSGLSQLDIHFIQQL